MNGDSTQSTEIVSELRNGFSQLSNDIRQMVTTTSAGLNNIQGDARYSSSVLKSAGERIKGTFAKGMGFVGQTFSSSYNAPAHIGRDLAYNWGLTSSRDMEAPLAKSLARRNLGMRGENLGSLVMKDILPTALMFTNTPLWAGYSAMTMGMEDKREVNKWKINLAQTSKQFIRGDVSTALEGTGWNENQLGQLASYHMSMGKNYKGISSGEQELLSQIAPAIGAMKDVSSVAEYKRNYRKLLDNTKEVMKTLHTSLDESVKLIQDMNQLGIKDVSGFTKLTGKATNLTNFTEDQIVQIASNVGGSFQKMGFSKDYSAKMAVEGAIAKEGVAIPGMLNIFSRKEMIASMLTPDMKYDPSTVAGVLNGTIGYTDLISKGSKNYGQINSSV